VLGLKMDPKEAATVERVKTGSIAGKAGVEFGDGIVALAGPLMGRGRSCIVTIGRGP
jgi:hypothetical protein